ncbi:MAG TPA: uroporphyrinogen-III synthase [Sphingomonadaceae bacterium]|nr:uroporphyrinogen-III synthase [Sphingomonadaceae bacterium]
MNAPLLILRPEPGASATAARVAKGGGRAISTPLFTVKAESWHPPSPDGFDALMLTSAHAARLAGPAIAAYAHLPVYAVGAATASAARKAGLRQIREGDSDGQALVERAARDGISRMLHLAGREHRPLATPGLLIERRIVYAADPVAQLPAAARSALADDAVTLIHSPRAGTLFRQLLAEAGGSPEKLRLATISAAAAQAAGEGWRALAIARQPTDDALLAAAARLCD